MALVTCLTLAQSACVPAPAPARTRAPTQAPAVVSPTPDTAARIANDMSAAPMTVAKAATIVDWPAQQGGDLGVLRKGTNNLDLLHRLGGSTGDDPDCSDPVMEAWSRALMAREKKPAEIAGPGIVYMLMGGSDPSNVDPIAATPAAHEDWVTSSAHVMLAVPGGFDAKQFTTDPLRDSRTSCGRARLAST